MLRLGARIEANLSPADQAWWKRLIDSDLDDREAYEALTGMHSLAEAAALETSDRGEGNPLAAARRLAAAVEPPAGVNTRPINGNPDHADGKTNEPNDNVGEAAATGRPGKDSVLGQILRELGLGTRGIIDGALGLGEVVTDPIRRGMN